MSTSLKQFICPRSIGLSICPIKPLDNPKMIAISSSKRFFSLRISVNKICLVILSSKFYGSHNFITDTLVLNALEYHHTESHPTNLTIQHM